MRKKEKLYTIGEVSKIVQLSASSLRFYDEQGVLTPQVRDADSGYRYYTGGQVLEASLIASMRRLDAPLSAIRSILSEKQLMEYRSTVLDRMHSLEQEIEQLRFKHAYARELLNNADTGLGLIYQKRLQGDAAPAVTIRYIPERYAVKIEVQGSFNEQEKFTSSHEKLYDICEKNVLEICGPVSVIFKEMGDGHFSKSVYRSDWLLPVRQTQKGIPSLTRYDACWYASVTHIGPYETIPQAYAQLLDYIAAHELHVIAPPMEEYIIEGIHVGGSGEYVTTVNIPISPPAGQ